ncbi:MULTISPECIES: GAF and ANTAR domain-containing protein [unclassified Streptomyces]|uniref:GAF and ANTAR domain-containing protein n=1 Tax=unclassified Streptomyces TaxID=2593676 RepID=UPI00381DA609
MAEALVSLRRGEWPQRARLAAVALGVDGVSTALAGDTSPRKTPGSREAAEVLWCSGPLSRAFEDLQYTVGEGPAADAVRTGHAVLAPDLRRVRADRWPALVPEAERLPVRAVFCFPIALGAIRIGVLTAVRATAGALGTEQTGDALVLADALAARYLGDEGGAELPGTLYSAVVHQAAGMASVQLGLPLADALLRLRAHAFRSGRPIRVVAHDVVARRLRLDVNGDGTLPSTAADKD